MGDATRDVVPENIEVDATREGKILGGASVKSLDAGSMSREEVVLTSEEAIRDASSSVLDDEVMKVEEFRDEKAEKDEAKKPERGRSEALSSTASPSSAVAFSLVSMITFLTTILTSNSISNFSLIRT